MQNFNDGASSSSGSTYTSDEIRYAKASFKKPPKNIVINDDTLAKQKFAKKATQQEIAQNKSDQQRIDLEVLLTGFTSKPDVAVVVRNLFELLQLPTSFARSSYFFESRDGNSDKRFYVVITLADKSSKIKLLDSIASKKGPLWLSEISKSSQSNDVAIKCCNRLTKFNNSVERNLKTLHSRGLICEFKYGSYCFEFKYSTNSEWKMVTHLAVLDFYNGLLKIKMST